MSNHTQSTYAEIIENHHGMNYEEANEMQEYFGISKEAAILLLILHKLQEVRGQ